MSTPTDPYIGRELDGYKILEMLGRGGMARVYRALDVKLKRFAAVKIIDPDVRDPRKYQLRFDREARAIAKLKHPNIVSIYRFNEVRGVYYMAMEYVDGADLRWVLKDYRREDQTMDWRTVAQIIRQIASALDYAHENGVIHRDIKPSNIMIARDGNAILTDFGLVLMASEGTIGEIFGSPHYIAPEQAVNSANAGTQTDLYSLGVVLYEMLTGDVPYNEGSAMEIAMSHMSAKLPDPVERKPELPLAFKPVIEKALAKETKDRYQTGAEFSKALDDALRYVLKQQPIPTDSISRPELRIQERLQPLSPPAEDSDDIVNTISPDPPAEQEPAAQAGRKVRQPMQRRSTGASGYLAAFVALLMLGVTLILFIVVVQSPPANASPEISTGYAADYQPEPPTTLDEQNAMLVGEIETYSGGSSFTAYGLTITIADEAMPEWDTDAIVPGATFEISGVAQESGSGVILYSVDSFEVNGRSILPRE